MTARRRPLPAYIGGGAPLTITVTGRPGATNIAAAGELDRETGSRLGAAVADAVGEQPLVELDLSGVTFMDSQGLRFLLESKFAARDRAEIVITDASSQVRELLEMTGLVEAFALAPDPRR